VKIMETSKESLLMADDSKTRDAILFDIMSSISSKIDKTNEIEDRVEECENSILCIGRVGASSVAVFSLVMAWLGIK